MKYGYQVESRGTKTPIYHWVVFPLYDKKMPYRINEKIEYIRKHNLRGRTGITIDPLYVQDMIDFWPMVLEMQDTRQTPPKFETWAKTFTPAPNCLKRGICTIFSESEETYA